MPDHTRAEQLAEASRPNEIETLYSYLLVAFMNATRDDDELRRHNCDVAIRLFEELWPEDTARWMARFPKRDPQP